MEEAPKGILNLGNTCYINTCIQILSHINSFSKILREIHIRNTTKIDHLLWNNWKNIIDIMDDNKTGEVLHPNGLITAIHNISKHKKKAFLKNHEPEDIGEFIIFLIESLHECISREIDISISGNSQNSLDDLAIEVYKKTKEEFEKQYSEINMLFRGVQVSQVLSLDGSTVHTRNVEGFYLLDLPLISNSGENIDLYECIDNYVKPEILDGENQWLNEKTNQKESIQKSISFWSFPELFIISLKRIDFMGNKINTNVLYPLELNLSKYVIGYKKLEFQYELVGICCHHGNSHYGHYTAFVKKKDKWYFCNDEVVQVVENNEYLQTSFAYCLFYTKKK